MHFFWFCLLTGQAYATYWTYNSSLLTIYLSNQKYNNVLITPDNIQYITLGLKIVIYVHGWLSNATFPSVQSAEDAIVAGNDSNFIKANWGPLASQIFYPYSAYSVGPVGDNLGDFISDLYGLGHDMNVVYLVGFSLGAHVSGKAGNRIKMNIEQQIFRISGLEPAGPLFYKVPNVTMNYILQASDATFVDVLHTNAGFAGTTQNLGKVNFYANCGSLQPGCTNIDLDLESLLIGLTDNNTIQCSHDRALTLWIESTVSNNLLAGRSQSFQNLECLPIVQFGYDVDTSISGLFYFNTNDKSPFGLGASGACTNCIL